MSREREVRSRTGCRRHQGPARVRPCLCSQSLCPLQLQTHVPRQPQAGASAPAPPRNANNSRVGTRQHGCVVTCQALTSLSRDNHLGDCACFTGEENKAQSSRSAAALDSQLGNSGTGTVTQVPNSVGPPMAWSGAPLSGPAIGE